MKYFVINLILLTFGFTNSIRYLTPENPPELIIAGIIFLIFLGYRTFPLKEVKYGLAIQVFLIIMFAVPAMLPHPILKVFAILYTLAGFYYTNEPGRFKIGISQDALYKPKDLSIDEWNEVDKIDGPYREDVLNEIREKHIKEKQRIKERADKIDW